MDTLIRNEADEASEKLNIPVIQIEWQEWKEFAFDTNKFMEWLSISVHRYYKNNMTDEDYKDKKFIEKKWIKVRSIIDNKRKLELVSIFTKKNLLIAQLPLINFVYEVTNTENNSVNTVLSKWDNDWIRVTNEWGKITKD